MPTLQLVCAPHDVVLVMQLCAFNFVLFAVLILTGVLTFTVTVVQLLALAHAALLLSYCYLPPVTDTVLVFALPDRYAGSLPTNSDWLAHSLVQLEAGRNYAIGIAAVLSQAALSGFAGVYQEMVLKSETPM